MREKADLKGAMIEFRTLGTLDLRRTHGPQLDSLLAQPKRIALLAYLCLASPHFRDSFSMKFRRSSDSVANYRNQSAMFDASRIAQARKKKRVCSPSRFSN